MNVAFFGSRTYEPPFFDRANADGRHQITYLEPRLAPETATLAAGHEGVCVFVNDELSAEVVERISGHGVKAIALRCAGFNNVDIDAAEKHEITVVRAPAYSPASTAEHAVTLMMGLNRKLHRAYNRVRDGNFSLAGLMGFNMEGKTAGIIGTGKIGQGVARILHGFGCRLLGYDPYPNDFCRELGLAYVDIDELYAASHIITLHCPLSPDSYHMIAAAAIARMRQGVMLINTSRGGLVDTQAVIDGLKSGRVGSLGIDVYQEEADLFFEDLSTEVIQDDVFARLLTFPNVIVTGHQAFFTQESMEAIAETTIDNLSQLERGEACPNQVTRQRHYRRA